MVVDVPNPTGLLQYERFWLKRGVQDTVGTVLQRCPKRIAELARHQQGRPMVGGEQAHNVL